MNNDSKFSSGFLLGLIIGGGAVFLFGTKTGKNLLKIVSEQGLDGIVSLLEEYDLSEIEEEEEIMEPSPTSNGHVSTVSEHVESKEEPKRRFFKRIRR